MQGIWLDTLSVSFGPCNNPMYPTSVTPFHGRGHLPTSLSMPSKKGVSFSWGQGQQSSQVHTVLNTYSGKKDIEDLGKIWLRLPALFMANATFLFSSTHFSLSQLPITGYAMCLSLPFFTFLLESSPEVGPSSLWTSFNHSLSMTVA